MADERKSRFDPNAERITKWLADNRAEFEDQGVAEEKLAAAVGMSPEDVTETIDHLEAREELVRVPHGLSTPPQFVLKPGRGWTEVRDGLRGDTRAANQKA
jgi:hypothetical protein